MISLMVLAVLCLALVSGITQTTPSERHGPAPSASVSGRLLTEDSAPLVSGTVVMSPTHASRTAEHAASEATVQPDGSFTFHDVQPGEYVMRARARTQRGGVSLFATFVLVVHDRDVQNIVLTLKPGGTLRGEVVIDARHGNASPSLDALRIRAPLPDGSSFGDARGADVRPDGAFDLQSVMAGTHVLVVQGLVFPWRISEARILGQDAAERAFDVEARQQVDGVRIVLSDIAAGVAGTVSLPPGISHSNVLVVAFPADPLRRALPLRFVRAGRPGPDGSYRIVDLATGPHRVAAVLHATEQDALSPDMLERWMGRSTPVTLVEAQVSTVALQAVAAPASASLP